MDHGEKIKRVTWRVARRALEHGGWAHVQNPVPAACVVVDLANVVVVSLADKGCLDDAFGDDGSLEVELAAGFVSNNSTLPTILTGTPVTWFSDELFSHVRRLAEAGLLTPEDRARARTFAFDAEMAEEERRKTAEAEEERKRRERQERQKLAARAKAAKKRLAEIEAEKAKEAK